MREPSKIDHKIQYDFSWLKLTRCKMVFMASALLGTTKGQQLFVLKGLLWLNTMALVVALLPRKGGGEGLGCEQEKCGFVA